jgi:hypothetical protein
MTLYHTGKPPTRRKIIAAFYEGAVVKRVGRKE